MSLSSTLSLKEMAETSDALSLRAQYQTLWAEKESQASEISQLTERLNESLSNLLIKESNLNECESQLRTTRLEMEELSSYNSKHLTEISQQKQTILTLTADCHTLQETCDKSRQNQQSLTERVTLLETTLSQSTASLVALREELNEEKLKQTKARKEIIELTDLISDQNKFLSDASESFDVAEEEIEAFETELLEAHAEIKRLRSDLRSIGEEKKAFQMKQIAFENKISKLQKENLSLQNLRKSEEEGEEQLLESSSTTSTTAQTLLPQFNKHFLSTIYSKPTKNTIPLSAYVQLQRDNQKLLLRLSHQNRQLNDLTEILRSAFMWKPKQPQSLLAPPVVTPPLASTEILPEVSDVDNTWHAMNQLPVFSGYSYLCHRHSNQQDGNIFLKSSHSSCAIKKELSIELQSTTLPLPLSPQERYLYEVIRRLRIGWTLIQVYSSHSFMIILMGMRS
jgi:chromosome segregation ATPase